MNNLLRFKKECIPGIKLMYDEDERQLNMNNSLANIPPKENYHLD